MIRIRFFFEKGGNNLQVCGIKGQIDYSTFENLRKMKSLVLVLCLLVAGTYSADAQFNKLKNKLGNKLNKKKNEQVDKEVDKKKNNAGFDISSMLGGDASNLDLEESYAYNFAVDYTVTSEDTKEPTEMTQLFATNGKHFGMILQAEENEADISEVVALMDFERNYLIAVNEEDGQAMVLEFENIEDQIAEENEEEPVEFKVTKTSNTKKILGYLCTQYLYSSEDSNGEMWVTEDLDYTSFDVFAYMKQLSTRQAQKENQVWGSDFSGFVLHIKGTDDEGKAFEMIANKVDTDADYAYQMSDYKVLDLTKLSRGLGDFNNKR